MASSCLNWHACWDLRIIPANYQEPQPSGAATPEDPACQHTACNVIVPKPGGGSRVCVDMTKLNRFVDRSTHPLWTPKEAVTGISRNAR